MGTSKSSKIGDKMKIRYISNFTDGTEWSRCATYNVLALENIGHDIFCSEIKYNNENIVFDEKIRDLLTKKSDSYDITIQHVLPMNYIKYADTKNIGFFPIDCTISDTILKKKINLMDEMLVPSYESKKLFLESGFKTPVKVMYNLFDYDEIANFKSQNNISQMNGTCNFVFMNEYSKQKNMEAVLSAYYTEFARIEPVNLVIAVEQNPDTINSFVKEVKSRLKSPTKLKDELIYSGTLSMESKLSILSQANCLVVPSYSEGSAYTAMEASALGIPIIYTENIGVQSYVDRSFNYPVKSTKEMCYGALNSLDGLYTCNDKWYRINIDDLRTQMRKVFMLFANNQGSTRQESISNSVKKFDYRNKKIMENILWKFISVPKI